MGLALLALFIFGKVLAPTFGMWLWEKLFGSPKRNNRDLDFDQLIETKKAILRRGEPASREGQIQHPQKKSNPTQQKYREAFSHLSQKSNRTEIEEEKLEQYKFILTLFDALQWGGGKEIHDISQKLSKKIGIRIEDTTVTHLIKKMLKYDWALLRKSNKLPTLNELTPLWECYLFWELILEELWGTGGKLTKSLQSKFHTSQKDLEKAIISIFSKIQNPQVSPKQILEGKVDLITKEKLDVIAPKFLLSEDLKFFQPKKEWLKKLEEEIIFYSSLTPLPPLKNDKDKEGAMRALGVTKEMELEEIKKVYRKLALLKHPDKLSAKGIPKEFEFIATENFALIQRAYDILKKKM